MRHAPIGPCCWGQSSCWWWAQGRGRSTHASAKAIAPEQSKSGKRSVADDADQGQLPHLETFSKAAELSNFTGAAKALRLTQAAVSQRIHALEETLGKPLF